MFKKIFLATFLISASVTLLLGISLGVGYHFGVSLEILDSINLYFNIICLIFLGHLPFILYVMFWRTK